MNNVGLASEKAIQILEATSIWGALPSNHRHPNRSLEAALDIRKSSSRGHTRRPRSLRKEVLTTEKQRKAAPHLAGTSRVIPDSKSQSVETQPWSGTEILRPKRLMSVGKSHRASKSNQRAAS